MKVKTAELIGPALDWAVAKCEGLPEGEVFGRGCVKDSGFYKKNKHGDFEPMLLQNTHDKWVKQCETYPWGKGQVIWRPSVDWAQGGALIELEHLEVSPAFSNTAWVAGYPNNPTSKQYWSNGPTPLIAAMRCFCCAKLGDEIEIPKELQPCQPPNL